MKFKKEIISEQADSKKRSADLPPKSSDSHASLTDNRKATIVQAKQRQETQHSDRTASQQQMFSSAFGESASNSGMPGHLQAGLENLSGLDLTDIRVHYNSAQPSAVGALAYAQGNHIHLAPGQEQHLPHEAWHVVQQKQNRVKPTLQWQNGIPINDDAGLEREADTMGKKADHHAAFHASQHISDKPSSRLDAHLCAPAQQPHPSAHAVAPVQRVIIPGTEHDTTKTKPDPGLLNSLSVIQLIGFWRSVYREDGENARAWRLTICEVILTRLEDRKYGPYQRELLKPLSKEKVNESLQHKKPLGKGSIKSVSSIEVDGHELAAARLQTSTDENDLTGEATMLQILALIGVRTPALYGTQTDEQTPPDLHRDAKNNLNLLMDQVPTNQDVLQVWDMQVGGLAHRLNEFLTLAPDEDTFNTLKANMLSDLRRIRAVLEVLTISDLQMILEDSTGHLVVFDPGAVVPRGTAGDKDKEGKTYLNLRHACEEIGKAMFVVKQTTITPDEAQYIGAFTSPKDLVIRINKVINKGVEENDLSKITITEQQIRTIITVNAGLKDLGEVVDEDDITNAILALNKARSQKK